MGRGLKEYLALAKLNRLELRISSQVDLVKHGG